jgi:hypothetical protein
MNPQPLTIVTLSDALDVSTAQCSTPVEICSMWWGRLEFVLDNIVGGDPIVTLEADVAGGGFAPQAECIKVTLDETLTQVRAGYIDGSKYRVCIDPNGATGGTLTTKMLLKKL